MDDHAAIRSRLVAYLTQAGLSAPRAHAELDAFLSSAPTAERPMPGSPHQNMMDFLEESDQIIGEGK